MANLHRVVVIGGGFGGLGAVRQLKRAPGMHLTIVHCKDYHRMGRVFAAYRDGNATAPFSPPRAIIPRSHGLAWAYVALSRPSCSNQRLAAFATYAAGFRGSLGRANASAP